MMLSIIVPTYNERANIRLVLSGIDKALESGSEHEIIVVDDASPDGTSEEVEAIIKELKGVRLLERSAKLGLTSAICEGAAITKGEWLLVMDADLSHPPESVRLMVAAMDGHDIVIGTRSAVENWPLHRKMISKGAELLARLMTGTKVADPMSGFFAVRKEIFMKTRFRTRGYKLLLNLLFDNPGLKIIELPYAFKDRHAGKTKLGTMEMLRYVFDLIAIRFG